MIYTELTNKAMKLAYDAHHGQLDVNGVPYIFHPFHVAEQMPDEITTCTALLHDVVEDTDVTLEDLEGEFPPEVIDALRLLTHDDATDYFDYVRAICTNPVARTVKLADLDHNQDESRITDPDAVPPARLERWRKKYKKAREILEADDAPSIRKASPDDLPAILSIYQTAREFMAAHGNATQWGTNRPSPEVVKSDIENGRLHVISSNGAIHGVFAFLEGAEPDYAVIENGSWIADTPYRAVHRVAGDGVLKGVVTHCMDFCKKQCGHLRIDTHENNHVMQHVLEKNGFRKCGIIHLSDGSPRIAYEYIAPECIAPDNPASL